MLEKTHQDENQEEDQGEDQEDQVEDQVEDQGEEHCEGRRNSQRAPKMMLVVCSWEEWQQQGQYRVP